MGVRAEVGERTAGEGAGVHAEASAGAGAGAGEGDAALESVTGELARMSGRTQCGGFSYDGARRRTDRVMRSGAVPPIPPPPAPAASPPAPVGAQGGDELGHAEPGEPGEEPEACPTSDALHIVHDDAVLVVLSGRPPSSMTEPWPPRATNPEGETMLPVGPR